jgi:putative ABC transport system permease protein
VRPEFITHFDNYFALENEGIAEFLRGDWLYTSVFTYILAERHSNPARIQDQINEVRKKYADERVLQNVSYTLQPLTDIHLYSNFSYENNSGVLYLYIFSLAGILILSIASFNFINLSIARSLRRNKEIGMKKVLGLNRKSLIVQLLGESFLYVMVAFIFSIILLAAVVPVVNEVTGNQLFVYNLLTTPTLLVIGIVLLFTSLLAGGYPAFYISGIDIFKALKGQVAYRTGKFQLRKVLVVMQFLIAITLILFTLIVNRQLNFMREKPLGFDKDHVLTIPLFSESFNSIIGSQMTADYRKRMIAFEETVLMNSNIQSITCSSFLPGQGAVPALITTDSLKETANIFIPLVSVDYDFVKSYGINLIAGREFSRASGTDHLNAFIINKEALKTLGFKTAEDALGKRLAAVGKDDGEVIGVIDNYHVQGLQYGLQPLILEVAASKFSTFSVKINSAAMHESIQFLKAEWDKSFPESVFEYHFLDETLDNNYENEEKLARTIGYFSIFTYIIAGLGLFGLAAYINEQRVREVGIRKVLGATTRSIFITLSSEFLKLIAIAFTIAVPFSIYLMNNWLENFFYKTTIEAGMFAGVITSTLFVVLLTISYQTLKASKTNPATVLKAE